MTVALDPRAPGALEAATEAFVEAEAAVEAASTAVDEAREAAAMGRLRRGVTVARAQRRLRDAIERREIARAAIRGVEREQARLREDEVTAERARRNEAAKELAVERAVLAAWWADWLAGVERQLADYDETARQFNSKASAAGVGVHGHVAVPSDQGRAYASFADGLQRLRSGR